MSVPMAHFERMYADSEDPWEYRRRWYERRKRALTLAMLPHARYARAFEPGCSIGELSAELAARCDALLVSDGSEAAVRVARRRLAPWPHVRVEQRLLPDAWPEGTFELVVLWRRCQTPCFESFDTIRGTAALVSRLKRRPPRRNAGRGEKEAILKLIRRA